MFVMVAQYNKRRCEALQCQLQTAELCMTPRAICTVCNSAHYSMCIWDRWLNLQGGLRTVFGNRLMRRWPCVGFLNTIIICWNHVLVCWTFCRFVHFRWHHVFGTNTSSGGKQVTVVDLVIRLMHWCKCFPLGRSDIWWTTRLALALASMLLAALGGLFGRLMLPGLFRCWRIVRTSLHTYRL